MGMMLTNCPKCMDRFWMPSLEDAGICADCRLTKMMKRFARREARKNGHDKLTGWRKTSNPRSSWLLREWCLCKKCGGMLILYYLREGRPHIGGETMANDCSIKMQELYKPNR